MLLCNAREVIVKIMLNALRGVIRGHIERVCAKNKDSVEGPETNNSKSDNVITALIHKEETSQLFSVSASNKGRNIVDLCEHSVLNLNQG